MEVSLQPPDPHNSLSLAIPPSTQKPPPPPKPFPLLLQERPSREDCWSEGGTITLIDAWGHRYLDLNRGNLKQKHWKDVADSVNARGNGNKPQKTDVQCKNRMDTLKKKYKLEKSKIVMGGGPSKWPFYERLDELIGPSKNQKNSPTKTKAYEKPKPEESAEVPLLHNDTNNTDINAQNHNNYAATHTNTNTDTDIQNTSTDSISKSKDSVDMFDRCDHGLFNGIDGRNLKKRKLLKNSPFKDLARAILKLGEAYERVESTKQQQIIDLEKQRMELTKDLELKRMQLFMQTQVELAKMKYNKQGNSGRVF